MITLRYCPACRHWCRPNPESYYGKRATVQMLMGCVECGTLTQEFKSLKNVTDLVLREAMR